MNFYRSRSNLIHFTVLFLIIFLAVLSWPMISANPPSFVYYAIGAIGVSLFFLFFINLGFCVFRLKQKMMHILMSLLILITFVFITPLCAKRAGNVERAWFYQNGLQNYNLIVKKIYENKSQLTSKGEPLDDLVGRSHVYGKTNLDGTISIWFQGRGNWLRAGYLFYSGNELIARPGYANKFVFPDNPNDHPYFHLTNSWYEY